MRRRGWIIGLALITALALLGDGRWRVDAAPAGTIHYPDLQVIVPLDSFSIINNSASTREFRYTHNQSNVGDGPFELRLDYDPANDLAKAFQRIYTHDASTNWSIVGEAPVVGRFLFHPPHGHYHVPFASFGLFRVAADGSVGARVAVSPKVGFCIADSVPIASIPHQGTFGYRGDNCADPRSIGGISVGWGDLYDFHDDGQSIIYDPATIPNGDYWFRSVADPFNYFVEKDETNNITDIRLRISGTTVTVLAGPFHPDSTPAAVSLTAPSAGVVSGAAVAISADASHASGIASVQFLLDGNPLGSPDTAPPYTLVWNTTTVADGPHDVSAQALTPTGLYGTAFPVIVTVDNNGPTDPPPPSPVTISDVLVTNRTSSSATVTWTTNVLATGDVAYGPDASYGLFASDATFQTDHAIPLTGLTPSTTYHYQLTSRDAVGNAATAGDFIFTTPAVSELTCNWIAPVGGTIVSSVINLQAEAFGTASVRGLQFLLDGAPLGAEFTLEPYILPWDTRTVLNGNHVLSAVVRDPTNNQATCAPVTVVVSNNDASTSWTFCAAEGGVCAFTGTQEVRYGANGSYFYRTLSDGTVCSNGVFGDPIFGVAKECALRTAPEWTVCAAEGGLCAFTGTREVRYGANGSYSYRTLSEGTVCSNAVFGDPIFGVAKECALRTGPPATEWTVCAAEGSVCPFTGTQEVRYGANGSYFYRTLSDGTACNNDVFGDPIFGVAKECALSTAPPATDWTVCAAEGSVCPFAGTQEVRYGANGSYFYRTLSDGTACNNSVFGDPISGVAKECALRTALPATEWTVCAAEGGLCAFTGTQEVRYGANGSYVYRTLSDSAVCINAVFGDPIPGVAKECALRTR